MCPGEYERRYHEARRTWSARPATLPSRVGFDPEPQCNRTCSGGEDMRRGQVVWLCLAGTLAIGCGGEETPFDLGGGDGDAGNSDGGAGGDDGGETGDDGGSDDSGSGDDGSGTDDTGDVVDDGTLANYGWRRLVAARLSAAPGPPRRWCRSCSCCFPRPSGPPRLAARPGVRRSSPARTRARCLSSRAPCHPARR